MPCQPAQHVRPSKTRARPGTGAVARRRFSALCGSAIVGLAAAAAIAGLPVDTHAADKVFRVTAIPDESPTELVRKFKPLGEHLEKALGMKVQFVPVTDYAATVEALANGKVDLAWFGGFTFVQAKLRSNDQVEPIVQRTEDEQFKSVFITPADSGITGFANLKGRTLAFGSPSSTSGHLMPRHFLLQAGIDPDKDLKRISFSGAHDATVQAVAGGKVDAGALNISVWQKMLADGKVDPAKVKVFFTTPGYFDYNWTVRKDMPADLKAKLTQAFLGLDPARPQDKAILDLQRTVRFIPTRAANYRDIENVARSAGLLK
ncbi:MAG: putative selenate ABC transporter substrate-binding protein [Lautropia sp.]